MLKRPHFHPARCKVCGRPGDEVGGISQTGLCPEHSRERFLANQDGLKTMSGPYALHWRQRVAASVLPPDVMAALASVGVFALDDAESSE